MVLNPNFFLPGTDHLLKVQARMEDKVRIENLKSLLAFFDKFSRDTGGTLSLVLLAGKIAGQIERGAKECRRSATTALPNLREVPPPPAPDGRSYERPDVPYALMLVLSA